MSRPFVRAARLNAGAIAAITATLLAAGFCAVVAAPGADATGSNSIAVTVTGYDGLATAGPLDGASVLLFDSNGSPVGDPQTTTGGTTTFTGLSDGAYRIEALPPADDTDDQLRWYGGTTGTSYLGDPDTQAVTVASGTSASALINMPNGAGSISGVVHSSAGAALGEATVSIFNDTGSSDPNYQQDLLDVTTSDDDGSFAATGLPPGLYAVELTPPSTDPADLAQWYLASNANGAADQNHATQIEVSASASGGLSQSVGTVRLQAGGSISGKVTDASNPSGLNGALVRAFDGDGNEVGVEDITGDDGQAAGVYTIKGLPTGAYTVTVVPPSASGDGQSSAQFVSVVAGQTTAQNFNLSTGYSVTGTVHDSSGNPLDQATITVYGDDASTGGQSTYQTVIRTVTTNSSGAFTISSLAPSIYAIQVAPPSSDPGDLSQWYLSSNADGAQDQTGATAIDLNTSNATIPAITLQAGGTISGQVTDTSNATGLDGVSVTVNDTQGNPVAGPVTTANGGRYSIVGLAAGTYSVEVDATNGDQSQSASVTLTETSGVISSKSGLDFALVAGGSVSGTVKRSTGTGLLGAEVSLYGDVQGTPTYQQDLYDVSTASDGSFTLQGIPAGTYALKITAGGNDPADLDQWYVSGQPNGAASQTSGGVTPIVVSSGSMTATGVITLQAGGSISGTVKDHSGNALQGASVTVSQGSDTISTVQTDVNGGYDVVGLPAGTYSVEVDATNGDQSQTASVTLTETSGVISSKSGLNFALQFGVSLTGVVKDSGGNALSGATVSAFEVGSDYGGTPAQQTTTDANGNYALSGLVPNTNYVIQIQPPDSDTADLDEWYVHNTPGGASTPGTATVVNVSSNTAALSTATLPLGGSITGTLHGSNGSPLTSATITAADASGNTYDGVLSLSGGTFSVVGLPTGTYTLTVSATNGDSPLTQTVAVQQGQPTAVGTLTLSVGGSINGHVYGVGHAPVADVSVQVIINDPNNANYQQDVLGGNDPETDASGAYSVTGIPLGVPYTLEFTPKNEDPAVTYVTQFLGNKNTWEEPSATSVPPLSVTTPVTEDFTLRQGGGVAGTVTDASGPVSGAAVSLTDVAGNDLGDATTNPDGTYQILGILPGNGYTLTVTPGTDSADSPQSVTVSVQPGAPSQGHDFVLTAGATFTGRVTYPNGQPAANVDVTVQDSTGTPAAGNSSVPTDANGVYSLPGVPFGSYTVDVNDSTDTVGADGDQEYLEMWLGSGGSTAYFSSDAHFVSAAGGQTFTNNFTLAFPGKVKGKVTDFKGGVAGGNVAILDSQGVSELDAQDDGFYNDNGTYEIDDVPPGTYKIDVTPGDDSVDAEQIFTEKIAAASSYEAVVSSPMSFVLNRQFTKRPTPVIVGPIVGQKATVNLGTWSPTATSLTYQWYFNGKPINGATGATYKPTKSQLGGKLQVKVTGSAKHYQPTTVASAAVLVVNPFKKAPKPTISGKPKSGTTVSVTTKAWTPKANFTYRWYASGVAIKGATGSSLKVGKSLKGKKLTVTVTGTAKGYETIYTLTVGTVR